MDIEVPNTDPVLDPPYASHLARTHFRTQLEVGREIADYWSQLLKRAIAEASKGEVQDLVLVAGYIRNGLVAFDGCLVCLDAGAVAGAHISLRALWEAELNTKWILHAGKERWGKQAYVADLRRERDWYRRVIPGTDENARYVGAWKDTFDTSPPTHAALLAEAPGRVQEIDGLLVSSSYKKINSWFDAMRGPKPYEPDWYKPGPDAPTSIGDIATKLDRSAEYMLLYNLLSHYAHSSRPSAGFTVKEGGRVGIEPVRAFKDFSFAFRMATSLAMRFLHIATDEYRSGEKASLAAQYASRWRSRLPVPEVVENVEVVDI
jgi:hypothetical protein